MTKFQYASDLHLERRKTIPTIDISAPYLVLAGDIGDPYSSMYLTFLKWCSENYQYTFLITGNHEYYQHKKTMNQVDEHIRQQLLANHLSNVIFLQCDKWVAPDHSFQVLGCTLWSKIPLNKAYIIERSINDYSKIWEMDTVEKSNNIHAQHHEWLTKQICDDNIVPLIVVTHHLPSNSMVHSTFRKSPINEAFVTPKLEYQLLRKPVSIWIAGHTHHSTKNVINGVKTGVNPLGYPHEDSKFERNATLELD